MRTNTIPPAAFSFGQRVICTWHEAECAPTQAVITGINYDHRRGGDKVSYTITEDEGAQTDDISECMLSAAVPDSAPEGIAIKTMFHGVIEAPRIVSWDQYTNALNAAGARWRKRMADVEAELAREVEAVAELNQRLIERQESFLAQVVRIEETWRERLKEKVGLVWRRQEIDPQTVDGRYLVEFSDGSHEIVRAVSIGTERAYFEYDNGDAASPREWRWWAEVPPSGKK